ncbi:cAMP-dependent protein kinase subunit [Entomophthora muscae]|uniref:cAMP-dependent protein kinase subunit n=1 Tax=Entomophthora muscae TaxID=34485 RepID=A0ACC2TQ70_9FUNG|nr:cAMP-dependent protein kinase subunit [Entomophthora muscae]
MSLSKYWPLVNFFSTSTTNPHSFALIILNRPISPNCLVFKNLFKQANIRVCADGGANELYQTFVVDLKNKALENNESESFIPDYICGDLDSLLPEVEEYYKNKQVPIRHVQDQDSTDLTKSLQLIEELETSKNSVEKKLDIVVYGGIGGRFDHSLATIQFLYHIHDRLALVYSPKNITILLESGLKHTIHLPSQSQGNSCGLLPIGGPVTQCSTSGFRWNLTKQALEFGGLVSSSNIADNQTLVVDLTESNTNLPKKYPLVFNIEIKDDKH